MRSSTIEQRCAPDSVVLPAGAVEARVAGEAALPAGASLSRRTVSAFGWRFTSESSKLALQLAVQITLARLLPVEAFGLLAVAMLVINFGSRVSEIGTGPAIIQRLTLTERHVRVAFSLSLASGALFTLIVWFGAPAIAALFHAGAVTSVLRLIGFVFVISGVGTTAESLLQRRMDYRRLLKIDLVSHAVGYAGVGISLAVLHYGVWSLAWATLAQTAVRSMMLLLTARHPARLSLGGREVRDLMNFGIGMTLSRLASFAAQNADYFVVSRWLGTVALGLYSRAYQLMMLPIYQFTSINNAVLFPAYSSIQDDSARLRHGYLASIAVASMVVFPAFTMLAIVAPELMTGVFGPQWFGAVQSLQILCVAGAAYCIYSLADSLTRAKGALCVKFLYQSVYALCVFGGATLARSWGISGVAFAVLVATLVAYLLMAHLSLRLTHTDWRAFLLAQLPATAICSAVGVAGILVATLLRAGGVGPLAVCAVTLMAASAAGILAVFALPTRYQNATVAAGLVAVKTYGLDQMVVLRCRGLTDMRVATSSLARALLRRL
jgi:O-antigen/teichoic acid export membrane protein